MTVFALTLAFAPARLLERSLATYAETRATPDLRGYPHYILDNHYPIDKEANRAALRELADGHGLTVLDAGRNLGLHEGWNWAMGQIAPADDDVVIAYDGDSMPVSPGWDAALSRTIERDERVAWASLSNPRSLRDLRARGFREDVVDGIVRWTTKTSVTNSICAWRCGWLRSVGGLQEPGKWYGHLEAAMWAHVQRTGKRWVFLPQFGESDKLRDLHDRPYTVYKWRLSHERRTDLDFETWLKTEWPRDADYGPAPDQIP